MTSTKASRTACEQCLHCRWEDDFVLLVHEPDQQSLSAIVYDNDLIGADKEVGRVTLPVEEMPNGETQEQWFDLEPPEVRSAGNPLQLGIRVR